MFSEVKMASISSLSSPKRSKRAIQKRVISIPIKDVEGRLKGESSPPPADSWAWRKYGQKPIKGSPYPRGYYRCSSSKGCPARKQVERSRVDPSMLVVTYSCEHNHQYPPPSKNHHHHSSTRHNSKQEFIPLAPTKESEPEPEPEPEAEQLEAEPEPDQSDEKFTDLRDESLITTDEFSWFGEMETTSSTILESPIFADINREREAFYPMREEDASLFADLGELPECSTVFRHHGGVNPQAQIC